MRPRLDQQEKRTALIGVKVKQNTKDMINFISDREGRPMSTQINLILEAYATAYFKRNDINWDEYAPERKGGKQ